MATDMNSRRSLITGPPCCSCPLCSGFCFYKVFQRASPRIISIGGLSAFLCVC